ncbi:ATP-binding cassette domain-containing protein, partial [Pseudomonas veronii]
IQDIYDYRPREHGEVALKVDGLLGPGLREPVSFEVRKGEILGLFGLVGAGRTELFRLLSGLQRATAGQLELCGQALQLRSPRDAIAAGVLLCPEDRKKEGIIPLGSVAENINISARGAHSRFGWLLREGWEQGNAEQQIRGMKVKTPSAAQKIMYLSGGNQQKAI